MRNYGRIIRAGCISDGTATSVPIATAKQLRKAVNTDLVPSDRLRLEHFYFSKATIMANETDSPVLNQGSLTHVFNGPTSSPSRLAK